MKKIKEKLVLKRFCEQFKNRYVPYLPSLRKKGNLFYFLVRGDFKKFLVIGRNTFKILPLNYKSCSLLQKVFPSLFPAISKGKSSFGFGDRLGITTPAHIHAVKKFNIFPIFAQQSSRELKKTGRTWKKVIADAVFGIFQEGYKGHYGADADHIKTVSELKGAIRAGFTFFTLDLSDEIINTDSMLKKVEKIFNILKKEKKEFELEISVDETSRTTSYFDHIFIAEELKRRKVKFQSLALRFPGRFEKGIDYKGDTNEFEDKLKTHSAIAKKFGYKLSLHSGSDKFSIYPIFYKGTKGNFHIKTSGTSWLEAVKVIAKNNPSLYRRLHKLALKKFNYNKKFYDISTNLNQIPKLNKTSDEKLQDLLLNESIRQLIHISYGSLLSKFKKEIYKTLFIFEEEFYESVSRHLQKHLK
ncbi:MAG: tagaturonate epimerase family protein [Candidatus Firestonebacteria bacterium]